MDCSHNELDEDTSIRHDAASTVEPPKADHNNMRIIRIWRSARSKDYTTRRRQLTVESRRSVREQAVRSETSGFSHRCGITWNVSRYTMSVRKPCVSFLFPCRLIIIIARFLFCTVSHSNSLITIRVSP